MPDRLLLILLLCASWPASSQGATEFVPPPRVRVTGALELEASLPASRLDAGEADELLTLPGRGKRLAGTLLAQDADTVTIRAKGYDQPLRIPRRALAKIEVSRGRESRGKGAMIGLAAGFAVGFALGATCDGHEWVTCGASLGLFSGTLMAAPGALIGLAVPPGEHWEQIPSDSWKHARLSVVPRRGGAGLALSVGF